MKEYVKIIIEDQDNKILEHHFVRENSWSIPAGKIEGNETPQNAAVRELLERTGFEIKANKLTQIADELNFHVFKGKKQDIKKVAEPGERGGYSTTIRWN
ncbi:MAG: NUDIX hydrolase [Minisyncoccia bacterium]